MRANNWSLRRCQWPAKWPLPPKKKRLRRSLRIQTNDYREEHAKAKSREPWENLQQNIRDISCAVPRQGWPRLTILNTSSSTAKEEKFERTKNWIFISTQTCDVINYVFFNKMKKCSSVENWSLRLVHLVMSARILEDIDLRHMEWNVLNYIFSVHTTSFIRLCVFARIYVEIKHGNS